ncbi:GatB/YqeY domain-containing protein [Rhodobacteraceae bacterium NNCM2]|nr:GatB/YqeY domain-containing protein [Coraliihabitans acroporae]
MIREKISKSIKEAMLDKDNLRLSTLRLMLAAVKDREIAIRGEEGQTDLTDHEALLLFDKMVKQREESSATYEEAGRMELAECERAEIKVIREFLPKPLSGPEVEAAIKAAISETGASSIRDMGKVMGRLKSLHAGRMDFGEAGAQVKAALG